MTKYVLKYKVQGERVHSVLLGEMSEEQALEQFEAKKTRLFEGQAKFVRLFTQGTNVPHREWLFSPVEAVKPAMTEQALMERLAEKEHAGWSHWMAYLFSVCEKGPDGSVTIPSQFVQRWKRQVETPYAHLSEGEKQSDRRQAELILPIIDEYIRTKLG